MIERMLREQDVKRSNQIHTRPNQIMDRLFVVLKGLRPHAAGSLH